MRTLVGLVGDGGFGVEVMPLLCDSVNREFIGEDPRGIVAFILPSDGPCRVRGYASWSEAEFLQDTQRFKYFNVSVSNPIRRQQIAERYVESSIIPFEIKAKTVVEGENIDLGAGAILCSFVILTGHSQIGKFFHCNIYSYVAHDCIIGDYVTFAPKVCCNGNVHIESHAYIGTGVIIKDGTPDNPIVIGKGAVIGAGAVVTRSVEPYAIMVGNPARKLK